MWRIRFGPAAGVFFFQAEDGIRDDLVTGVQTCALPILSRFGVAGRCQPSKRLIHCPSPHRMCTNVPWIECQKAPRRSEERRVGKEGTSRWSPVHEKKKAARSMRCNKIASETQARCR